MDDLQMMSNPTEWPKWPFLPVKRVTRPGDNECGIIWVEKNHLTTVFLYNLYNLPKLVTEFVNGPQIRYDSYEAIIADGWVID